MGARSTVKAQHDRIYKNSSHLEEKTLAHHLSHLAHHPAPHLVLHLSVTHRLPVAAVLHQLHESVCHRLNLSIFQFFSSVDFQVLKLLCTPNPEAVGFYSTLTDKIPMLSSRDFLNVFPPSLSSMIAVSAKHGQMHCTWELFIRYF